MSGEGTDSGTGEAPAEAGVRSSEPSAPSVAGSCPRPHVEAERVLLGHGGGGLLSSELLEEVFLPVFDNDVLARREDQACLEIEGGRIAFTTDSFVVSPMFFPGGDIGRLAVHGTINDLAVGGARPAWLSAAFILEEGLPMADLRRVVGSMGFAAREAGVSIVTGDTKVVGRGAADGLYVTTTGIGVVPPGRALSAHAARPGDAVLISGTIGDHGLAVMALREGLGLEGAIESDTAPLHALVEALLAGAPGTRCLRDPTRGGVAATLSEIAELSSVGIELDEGSFPVSDDVRGACEILGLDPLVAANEGKLLAVVPPDEADAALAALRREPLGARAAIIGEVVATRAGRVEVRNDLGGRRVLERPHGELLPRIC